MTPGAPAEQRTLCAHGVQSSSGPGNRADLGAGPCHPTANGSEKSLRQTPRTGRIALRRLRSPNFPNWQQRHKALRPRASPVVASPTLKEIAAVRAKTPAAANQKNETKKATTPS